MEPDQGSATPTATVLVVEDETLVQMLILEVVADLGLEALDAHDAASALVIMESGAPIELLITDVGLPGMNGRRLAEAARSIRPDLKVLFVTGYAERHDVEASLALPGAAVITKPFALDELSRKIATMTGRV